MSAKDQTHLIHAIEHLSIARRELQESMKGDDSGYMGAIVNEMDINIKRLANRLE